MSSSPCSSILCECWESDRRSWNRGSRNAAETHRHSVHGGATGSGNDAALSPVQLFRTLAAGRHRLLDLEWSGRAPAPKSFSASAHPVFLFSLPLLSRHLSSLVSASPGTKIGCESKCVFMRNKKVDFFAKRTMVARSDGRNSY